VFYETRIHVWCKKFAHGRESVVDEDRPSRRVVSSTTAMIIPACDGINV